MIASNLLADDVLTVSPGLMTAIAIALLPFAFLLFAMAPVVFKGRRFSLRTLLIATTLVAVLLGAVIYAVR
jgi:hypothetical protein